MLIRFWGVFETWGGRLRLVAEGAWVTRKDGAARHLIRLRTLRSEFGQLCESNHMFESRARQAKAAEVGLILLRLRHGRTDCGKMRPCSLLVPLGKLSRVLTPPHRL